MGMRVNLLTPSEALTAIRKTIKASHVQYPGWQARCTATTTVFFLEDVYQALTATGNQLDDHVSRVTSVPDLVAWAQTEYGDNSNIVTDFQAWKTQAQVCIDWILANASGTLAAGQLGPTVDATPLVAELSTLRTLSE